MSFTLPTFNLTCNIRTTRATTGAPRVVSPCNLAWGRRAAVHAGATGSNANVQFFEGGTTLLLPAGTDVRDSWNATGEDCVEVPAGSGRFYRAWQVDDIGKGFANEHRVVILAKFAATGGFWPTPIP